MAGSLVRHKSLYYCIPNRILDRNDNNETEIEDNLSLDYFRRCITVDINWFSIEDNRILGFLEPIVLSNVLFNELFVYSMITFSFSNERVFYKNYIHCSRPRVATGPHCPTDGSSPIGSVYFRQGSVRRQSILNKVLITCKDWDNLTKSLWTASLLSSSTWRLDTLFFKCEFSASNLA